MCECFTCVVSAVAAHTELVRTLTTAPPAKRQPASSTGNLIKIMSGPHYITQQWQLSVSCSGINSPETSQRQLASFACCFSQCFSHSFSLFPHLFSTSSGNLLFFTSLSSWYPAVFALSPHTLIIVLLIQYIHPYYTTNARLWVIRLINNERD